MGNFFSDLGGTLMGQSGIGPSISLFNKLSLQQQQMLNKALGMQQLGINQIQGGFDAARKGVNQAKGAAKTEAKDSGAQAYGAAANSAVSRGLTNTSSLDAVNRGIGSDLAKHMAWIDAQAGQQLGALDVGQAQALNQGYGQMGQLYSQFGQQNAALAGPLMQQLAQGQPGILGPLLGAAGTYFGLAGMGGGAGAGAGWGAGAGAAAGGAAAFSDPRLKKEVEFEGMVHVKVTNEAIPTYSFEYKDPNMPGRYLGVMSTDVEHLPGIVHKGKGGFASVDYLKLYDLTGFSFRKIREGAVLSN
jgi:hypothetical protein